MYLISSKQLILLIYFLCYRRGGPSNVLECQRNSNRAMEKPSKESDMRYLRSKMIPTALLALTLGACAPQYSHHDWSGLVSKSETLRFMARASCTIPGSFNPVANDAAFFKVNHLEPVKGEPWTYTAELVGEDGMRRGRFVVSQRWNAAGVRTAPWEAVKDNQFCNVLAEVPVSPDRIHPYYVEPEGAKT